MSYAINCKKCGTKFLKVSMKSKETVCHLCRRRNRNSMVSQPFDEMSKVELLRAIQDMATKSVEMEDTIKRMNERLDTMQLQMSETFSDKRISEANIIGGAVYSIDDEMKRLYIKHNNRLLKLENKVFNGTKANTISKK